MFDSIKPKHQSIASMNSSFSISERVKRIVSLAQRAAYNHHRSKWIMPLAAITGMALVLTACSSTPPTTAAHTTSSTLVIGSDLNPPVLYGGVESGYAVATPSVELFASPVRYTNSNTPLPYLAKSWSFSPNHLHLTLNLVHNATFSNGTPVTSTDVAFSIDVIRKYQPFGQSMFGDVTSVSTPNPYTAILNFEVPDSSILTALSPALCPILPKSVYGKDFNNLMSDSQLSQHVVGSGPYRLTSFSYGNEIVMTARKHFFMKGDPKIHRIIIKTYPSATAMTLAAENGTIQLTDLTSPSDLKQLESYKNLAISRTSYSALGSLSFMEYNLKNPYLSHLKVREAIAYATDINYFIKDINDGFPVAAPSPIEPSSPYFDPNVKTYPFDIAKANTLLNEAGYPKQADGYRFSLNITYVPGIPSYGIDLAEDMKSTLAQAGINLNIVTYPDETSWEQAVSNYNYDLDLDIVANWGAPSIGVTRSWVCTNIRKGIVWANMSQYCNPAVDQAFQKAETATSVQAAKKYYDQAQELITSQLPADFLMTNVLDNVYIKSLINPPNGVWGAMSPLLTTQLP